jgi:RNase P/RNase MRP subunit p29
MRNWKLTSLVMLVFLSVPFSFAEVIPGRWEKVDSLVPGTPVLVELQSGDGIPGELVSTTAGSLVIDAASQNRMTVPKNAVARVLQMKKGKRQTLLGTLIGTGSGVVTGLVISTRFDETFFARQDLMALTCGGIGALTGALIGRAVRSPDREEVVFQSR